MVIQNTHQMSQQNCRSLTTASKSATSTAPRGGHFGRVVFRLVQAWESHADVIDCFWVLPNMTHKYGRLGKYGWQNRVRT